MVSPGGFRRAVGCGAGCGGAGVYDAVEAERAGAEKSVASAALALAAKVKAGDVSGLQSAAIEEYAASFNSTAVLVLDTAGALKGDSLQVTQIYMLDAHNRKPADTDDTDFSCPLQGTTAETDFSISGLPPGIYAFAMVEASGERPWLISLLMRQAAAGWRLAGLYPHARQAAGHDGLWYWNAAREDAKAKQAWSAWLLYGEADALLRPANFAASTNLDKLRAERQTATPPELQEGVSAQTPLVLHGTGGAQYSITGLASEGSDDGKRLNLVLHVQGDAEAAAAPAEMVFNSAAASALLTAHKELRQGFNSVTVIAETKGRAPFVTEQKVAEIH